MNGPTPVRLAYAAAHVALAPGSDTALDWEVTLGLRRWLDEQGFGVAEAMDTAQRFEIGWLTARELIARCGALKLKSGFCAGAGTDQRPQADSAAALVDAVVDQCAYISQFGGIPVILPMPWFAQNGASADAYVDAYGAIFKQVKGPVFVHWLGEMFLPSLRGYFPGDSFSRVMALAPEVARGCKISLLDAEREVDIRRELLPRDQIVLTGDDFHFARTILGGDPDGPPPAGPPRVARWTEIGGRKVALGDFSHALLGILDVIAVPARRALDALVLGDAATFLRIMEPCEALGRHVFEEPTRDYKAGLAFLSWLSGRQPDYRLPGGLEGNRDRRHYHKCVGLAYACGIASGDETLTRLARWMDDAR